MPERTAWQLVDEMMDEFHLKTLAWERAMSQWGGAYTSAVESFEMVLKEQDNATARNWAIFYTVVELVTVGTSKFLSACIPKTGPLPMPRLVNTARRELFWKKMETLEAFMAQPVNAGLRVLADAGVSKVYDMMKKPPKLLATGESPVKYYQNLKEQIAGIGLKIGEELAKIKREVDSVTKLSPLHAERFREQMIQSLARTPYWHPPVLTATEQDALRLEMERCLWALYIATKVVREYPDTSIAAQHFPRLNQFYLEHLEPGRFPHQHNGKQHVLNIQNTFGGTVAKHLGEKLGIKINGMPVHQYMGVVTLSDIRDLYEHWVETYLERGVKKFGTRFPSFVDNPYTDHVVGGFRIK